MSDGLDRGGIRIRRIEDDGTIHYTKNGTPKRIDPPGHSGKVDDLPGGRSE